MMSMNTNGFNRLRCYVTFFCECYFSFIGFSACAGASRIDAGAGGGVGLCDCARGITHLLYLNFPVFGIDLVGGWLIFEVDLITGISPHTPLCI